MRSMFYNSCVLCFYVTCCYTTKRHCIWVGVFTNTGYDSLRFFNEYNFNCNYQFNYIFPAACSMEFGRYDYNSLIRINFPSSFVAC